MPLIQEILDDLEQQVPLSLAEPWDNVGLLLGDSQVDVTGIVTCLTLTADVAAEVIRAGANLVITHHPILFKAVKRLTTQTSEGRMLLELIQAGVSIYSPHTAFDSAREGINQQIAQGLGLLDIQPIRPHLTTTPGAGRWGRLESAIPLSILIQRLKTVCPAEHYTYVGSLDHVFETVGVACGAAGDFLPDAARLGCKAFVTGETRFHGCLEARALGVALVMVGHYASERPAVERMAQSLAKRWPSLQVHVSHFESDPVKLYR